VRSPVDLPADADCLFCGIDDDPLRLQWVPGPGDPDEIAAAAELLKGAPSPRR
jgi:hypothetical protein